MKNVTASTVLNLIATVNRLQAAKYGPRRNAALDNAQRKLEATHRYDIRGTLRSVVTRNVNGTLAAA